MPNIYITKQTRTKLYRIAKEDRRPICTQVEILVQNEMDKRGLAKQQDIPDGVVKSSVTNN